MEVTEGFIGVAGIRVLLSHLCWVKNDPFHQHIFVTRQDTSTKHSDSKLYWNEIWHFFIWYVSDFDERHAIVLYGYHLKENIFKSNNKFIVKQYRIFIKIIHRSSSPSVSYWVFVCFILHEYFIVNLCLCWGCSNSISCWIFGGVSFLNTLQQIWKLYYSAPACALYFLLISNWAC